MTAPIDEAVKERIVTAFEQRTRHASLEDLRKTRSLASAEVQFREDYSGRFLIELLQNARDAYRERYADDRAAVLRIRRTRSALYVANVGMPLTVDALLGSLTQIGASTKKRGDAVGHKGIGFKSVLEVSETPEIFSGRGESGDFQLAVRFDRSIALDAIRRSVAQHSAPGAWEEWMDSLGGANRDPAHLPVLYFPVPFYEGAERQLVEDELRRVGKLGIVSFDTVVRLPILSAAEDLVHARISEALRGLDTSMLLLLGCFEQIEIEDEVEPQLSESIVFAHGAITSTPSGVRCREAEVARRDDAQRWLLYERSLEHAEGLTRELTIGVHLGEREGILTPELPPPTFHLFFPTEIKTRLPFLYHAYFWVDASRRSFADSRRGENEELLRELAVLTGQVVSNLVGMDRAFQKPLDVRSLVAAFAACRGRPDNKLADKMRSGALQQLEAIEWIPRLGGGWSTPKEVVAAEVAGVAAGPMARAFALSRLASVGAALAASEASSSEALRFLREELNAQTLDEELLAKLMRVGFEDRSDEDFAALLELLDKLDSDGLDVKQVIDDCRGEDNAAFIPVVDESGARRHIPPPVLEDRPGGRRAQRLFVSASRTEMTDFGPPDCLQFAFLPPIPGLKEERRDILRVLGVSEYSTNDVLLRLGEPLGDELSEEQHRLVTSFVWRFLLREARSSYSVSAAIGWSRPGEGFWRQDVQERANDDRRANQQRRKGMGRVRLPARDGTLREAAKLAISHEWGFDEPDRVAVLAAIGRLAPTSGHLVVGPVQLAEWLPLPERDEPTTEREETPDAAEGQRDHQRLLLAFLRQLGVWELIPIDAVSDHEVRASSEGERVPWVESPERQEQWRAVRSSIRLGTTSNQEGHAVHVSEDARLAWSVTGHGNREDVALVVRSGAEFYALQASAAFFCPQCRAHKQRQLAKIEKSLLRWQLERSPWLPVLKHGERGLASPRESWIVRDGVDGRQAERSAWSFLSVVEPEYRDVAARFGAREIERASAADIIEVLRTLRGAFESNSLGRNPVESAAARQAFTALHRRLCERLAALPVTNALGDVGVLAELGSELIYRSPADVLHDDGAQATFRRHFSGKVAFAVVARELSLEEARRLGLRPFRVKTDVSTNASLEEDQTEDFADVIREVAPFVLSLQVHAPVRGQPLEPGSVAFQERARRLHALRVIRVQELQLTLSVEGTSVSVLVATEAKGNLFLRDPSSKQPVLFHDLPPEQSDELVGRLGPYLAALVEAPAAADTLSLLLQRRSAGERLDFLLERGISEHEIEQVRIDVSRAVQPNLDEDERRWWSSIMTVLGFEVSGELNSLADVSEHLETLEDPIRQLLRHALEARDLGYGAALKEALRPYAAELDVELRRRGDLRGFRLAQPPAPPPGVPAPLAGMPLASPPTTPSTGAQDAPSQSAPPGPTAPRRRAADVWQAIGEVRRRGLVVSPVTPTEAVSGTRGGGGATGRAVRLVKVRRDEDQLARVGAQAERTALALAVAPLVALAESDENQFHAAVSEMLAALKQQFHGPAVDAVAAFGKRLLTGVADPDERVEVLARFLHLSDTSDAFGCDLLAWLEVADGQACRSLFVEVKSVQGGPQRSFLVTRNEWETARSLRASYAFLAVVRGESACELLVDPVALNECAPSVLRDSVDTYRFDYGTAATNHNARSRATVVESTTSSAAPEG